MAESPKHPAAERIRVLHFVTGGFSGGATQVALALVNAERAGEQIQPLLVLRRKMRGDPARITELEQSGVPIRTVTGWTHAATIWSLVRICKEFQPHVLVAHGFSEHLWGRYAGLLAKVPSLVHVEHNSRERYTRWRLAQARWLAQRTAAIVGVSEGVRTSLLEMGFPADRTMAIPNGVRLEPFAGADAYPFDQRIPGIVMVSRFGRQKDHATLLRAIALLRERNLRPPVLFAGGGKSSHRRSAEKLCRELKLDDQVQFLGVCRNVPELLLKHQIAVLSTHYEGMPLALVEGMAAGCAVVGSDVIGVRELIEDRVNGRLAAAKNPQALADVFESLLRAPEQAAALGRAARTAALERHSRELMDQRYEDLFVRLANARTPRPASRDEPL
ncbi:MAG: glycosyltransferase [Pseudomonadota bacterium]|nr:glycosyltransferase [Pseudomonadota bacterium]